MVSEARRQYLRDYQNRWVQKRRQDWIDEHGPCVRCGSFEDLEVDHIDAKTKELDVAAVWSMAFGNPRRIKELAKCQVLCGPCHDAKRGECRENAHGVSIGNTTLTEQQVREIRTRHGAGDISYQALAEEFKVDPRTISNICKRKTWKYLY